MVTYSVPSFSYYPLVLVTEFVGYYNIMKSPTMFNICQLQLKNKQLFDPVTAAEYILEVIFFLM